jgi:hypothetical protein
VRQAGHILHHHASKRCFLSNPPIESSRAVCDWTEWDQMLTPASTDHSGKETIQYADWLVATLCLMTEGKETNSLGSGKFLRLTHFWPSFNSGSLHMLCWVTPVSPPRFHQNFAS